jgi:hypothetical protein
MVTLVGIFHFVVFWKYNLKTCNLSTYGLYHNLPKFELRLQKKQQYWYQYQPNLTHFYYALLEEL